MPTIRIVALHIEEVNDNETTAVVPTIRIVALHIFLYWNHGNDTVMPTVRIVAMHIFLLWFTKKCFHDLCFKNDFVKIKGVALRNPLNHHY